MIGHIPVGMSLVWTKLTFELFISSSMAGFFVLFKGELGTDRLTAI